jgi:hypothetical protein
MLYRIIGALFIFAAASITAALIWTDYQIRRAFRRRMFLKGRI